MGRKMVFAALVLAMVIGFSGQASAWWPEGGSIGVNGECVFSISGVNVETELYIYGLLAEGVSVDGRRVTLTVTSSADLPRAVDFFYRRITM